DRAAVASARSDRRRVPRQINRGERRLVVSLVVADAAPELPVRTVAPALYAVGAARAAVHPARRHVGDAARPARTEPRQAAHAGGTGAVCRAFQHAVGLGRAVART